MQSVIDRLSNNLAESVGPLSTPCWIWQRSTSGRGYGQIWFDGGLWLTHRLSWLLEHGEIPTGKFVLHKCDRPLCCNPQHLFIGTAKDNAIDCVAKGRHIGTKYSILPRLKKQRKKL